MSSQSNTKIGGKVYNSCKDTRMTGKQLEENTLQGQTPGYPFSRK